MRWAACAWGLSSFSYTPPALGPLIQLQSEKEQRPPSRDSWLRSKFRTLTYFVTFGILCNISEPQSSGLNNGDTKNTYQIV